MEHKHIYDAQGKQLCCTLEQKINSNTSNVLQGVNPQNDHNHTEHSSAKNNLLSEFKLPIISLCLLLIAIAFDNWFPQTWFKGWVRIIWYVVAYAPVGLPVLKEAFESIAKKEIFSEFLLMCIATIGAFAAFG